MDPNGGSGSGMVQVERTAEFCKDCYEHQMHIRAIGSDFDFTACGECGKLLGDDAFTQVFTKDCDNCDDSTKHVRANTVITGVERGFINTSKKWACVECGEVQ